MVAWILLLLQLQTEILKQSGDSCPLHQDNRRALFAAFAAGDSSALRARVHVSLLRCVSACSAVAPKGQWVQITPSCISEMTYWPLASNRVQQKNTCMCIWSKFNASNFQFFCPVQRGLVTLLPFPTWKFCFLSSIASKISLLLQCFYCFCCKSIWHQL